MGRFDGIRSGDCSGDTQCRPQLGFFSAVCVVCLMGVCVQQYPFWGWDLIMTLMATVLAGCSHDIHACHLVE